MEIEYAKGLNENARSLWKICRAMANPLRLELLRLIYTQQGDNFENQIVRIVGARQAVVSNYLNQLVAAGLIGVERDRVKAYFKPWPRHHETEELCRVLAEYFHGELPDNWNHELMKSIRPFSHFNRLMMIGRLLQGPATKAQLGECAGTIVKTLNHHLQIINAAGMIRKIKKGPNPMELEIVRNCNPLIEVLLMYLECDFASGQDYRNLINDRAIDKTSAWVLKSVRKAEGDDWRAPPPERVSTPIDNELASALDEPNHD